MREVKATEEPEIDIKMFEVQVHGTMYVCAVDDVEAEVYALEAIRNNDLDACGIEFVNTSVAETLESNWGEGGTPFGDSFMLSCNDWLKLNKKDAKKIVVFNNELYIKIEP